MAWYRKHHLSEATFEKLAERFKALSEPMRLRLVYALMDGEKTVSQLVRETGALQANVAKHLGILLDADILGRRKEGTSAYYRITDESVFELCDLVCGSIEDRLAAELRNFSAASSAAGRSARS
jgi:DNA-binding transcriptional ArsR family regulator